jgi:hypothetical protein
MAIRLGSDLGGTRPGKAAGMLRAAFPQVLLQSGVGEDARERHLKLFQRTGVKDHRGIADSFR